MAEVLAEQVEQEVGAARNTRTPHLGDNDTVGWRLTTHGGGIFWGNICFSKRVKWRAAKIKTDQMKSVQ